jgi:hypothetical protein
MMMMQNIRPLGWSVSHLIVAAGIAVVAALGTAACGGQAADGEVGTIAEATTTHACGTPNTVLGAIEACWADEGACAWGVPTNNETPTPDEKEYFDASGTLIGSARARFQHYVPSNCYWNGQCPSWTKHNLPGGAPLASQSHYWTPWTGANMIQGKIWEEFANQGWEQFWGYPLSSEFRAPCPAPFDTDSCAESDFEQGSIFWDFTRGTILEGAWSPDGTFVRWGAKAKPQYGRAKCCDGSRRTANVDPNCKKSPHDCCDDAVKAALKLCPPECVGQNQADGCSYQ